ncbi:MULTISPECIES: zinc metallopeptidase [unclassified Roseitalea]|uniref:zinc metallopeptidase n=1 Tax=unclassified Roseitalea TaxID=2639107 RepID=UPI00273E94A8|nr:MULTISPECIES: zinc metallopeptidase [unclassified Roseitalea]
MALLGLLGLLVLAAAVLLPQMWVRRVMARHGAARADFPGTGGELAEHLIDRFGLDGVGVETTDGGDHYDPESRTVRLSASTHGGASLTAVAIAAHEVGHAIQHARGETGLRLRQALVRLARVSDRFAALFFIAAPILTVIVRSPGAFVGLAAIGIALLSVRVLVHLVTLPVEYDASFSKALPILKDGGYLREKDLGGARQVLKAAALTYVAGALVSLIDLARWARLLR